MKTKLLISLILISSSFLTSSIFLNSRADAAMGRGCGSSCFASLYNYCPTCNMMQSRSPFYSATPWGAAPPYYWNTGPMMYPGNFYQPGPWYAAGPSPYAMPYTSPGIMGNYYPGSGGFFAAKPNLYVMGPLATKVQVKINLLEKDTNWLATVPAHGLEGWQVTLAEKNKLISDGVTHGYLYSDYRAQDKELQDQKGFCTEKENLIAKLAIEMKRADFTSREIGDFMEFWSVKLPASDSYCVFPQDEAQLDKIAALEISPRPVAVRRLLFLVQVKEGLSTDDKPSAAKPKFSKPPTMAWNPQPLRTIASEPKGIVVHEWGVGFLAATPK